MTYSSMMVKKMVAMIAVGVTTLIQLSVAQAVMPLSARTRPVSQAGAVTSLGDQGSRSAKSVQQNISVAELVALIGVSDNTSRRNALKSVTHFRNRYVEFATENLVNSREIGSRWRVTNYRACLVLRPSKIQLLAECDKDFFTVTPSDPLKVTLGLRPPPRWAADTLVASSLPSLLILAERLAAAPLTGANKDFETEKFLAIGSIVSVLGPASPEWLTQSAIRRVKPTERDALQQWSTFVADQYTKGYTTHDAYFFAGGHLVRERLLDNAHNPNEWNKVDMEKQFLNWNVREESLLANVASLRALQFVLMQHIDKSANHDEKKYPLFPPEAQTDAIRLLGCLRSSIASWVIWDRLRRVTMKKPLHEDNSEDTLACLRSLGQIDIPAARMLVSRVSSEWGEGQQLGATFALGKVMGRYAVPLLEDQVKLLNDGLRGVTSRSEIQGVKTQIFRVENALKVGKEKKWFEGEYYGYSDPHAYDLIFPEEKPEAPKPAGEVKPPVPAGPFGGAVGGQK